MRMKMPERREVSIERCSPDEGSSSKKERFAQSLWAALVDFSPPFFHAARDCAVFGAIGILSGYALFILLWGKQEHPWRFLFALGPGAGGLACFIEWARHAIFAQGDHELSWSWSNVVVNSVVLATFELFVIAGHTVFEMNPEQFRAVVEVVLGGILAQESSAYWDLFIFACTWIVAGAMTSASMTCVIRLVRDASHRAWPQFGWPAAVGLLVGGIAAPVCVLLGLLLARTAFTLSWTVQDPESWLRYVRHAAKRYFNDGTFFLAPIWWLALAGNAAWWAPLLIVSMLLALAIWCYRKRYLGWLVLICVFGIWTLLGLLLLVLRTCPGISITTYATCDRGATV
jgi:hypothetical protein